MFKIYYLTVLIKNIFFGKGKNCNYKMDKKSKKSKSSTKKAADTPPGIYLFIYLFLLVYLQYEII